MPDLATMFPTRSLIPVVVIDDANDAVSLAEALLAGGITSIEITLRTEAGLPAIGAIAKAVPDILVGAGTVLSPAQMEQAANAGAVFQVSPGVTDVLADYAKAKNIAWLPGTANASNVMLVKEYGFSHVKLFPASLVGGVGMIKQFTSVFPDVRICPTGGISRENMHDYAALNSVFAIGGSWLAPKAAMQNKDWAGITQIAKESVAALAGA